jgi:hypothetical protein
MIRLLPFILLTALAVLVAVFVARRRVIFDLARKV